MKKKIFSIVALLLCVCMIFSGCDSVTSLLSGENDTIDYEIENGEATVITVPNKSTMTVVEIPDEIDGVPVTKIADYSAFNLEYVTEIIIGKNVREIGSWSMTNNHQLQKFTVSEENEYFCSVDGVLYTKDMKTIVYCPNTMDGEYNVADGVELIRSKAFYKCNKLTKIILPETVKDIEEKAFFRCETVTELSLPNSLQNIGKDAFAYCYGLTSITIPASIKTIDEYAFYNCTNLLKVNVDAKESDIELGNKWFPTNNGLDINELEIVWKQ